MVTMDFEADIPRDLAYAAHGGTSFVPERRAEQEQAEYANTLRSDLATLTERCATEEERARLAEQFERYRAGYRRRYTAQLAARSRVLSPMITGPARFPVASNNKRCDSYERRVNELVEYRRRALRAINRMMWPADNGIRQAAPDAAELLRQKIDEKKRFQETMKAANRIVRSKKPDAERIAAIVALGIGETNARKLLEPDFCGRRGFPDYALQNNLAEIKRLEQRALQVAALPTAIEKADADYGPIKVEADPKAERVYIWTPGRNEEATRILKGHGWHWARSLGCWSRILTIRAVLVSKEIGPKLAAVYAA